MTFLEDIAKAQRDIRAEFGAPIIRVELGRNQMAELATRAIYSSESKATPSIYGVPLWAMPVDDWFRIVREKDE